MNIIAGAFIYETRKEYEEFANRLYSNGVSDIRINCSNFNVDVIINHVKILRDVFSKFDYPLNIFLDVPFPGEKSRIICKDDVFSFKVNQVYSLSSNRITNSDLIIESSNIINNLEKGDLIYIDDGKFTFSVIKIDSELISIKANQSGKVLNGKAIYTENYRFEKSNNKMDLDSLKTLLGETKPEYVILSFCEESSDIICVKEMVDGLGLNSKIIPKIETIKGIENLKELFQYVDILMLGRGDLGGTFASILNLGKVQNDFIEECHKNDKKVLIATDILSSLANDKIIPVRGEVIDLYYLLSKKVEYIFSSATISNKDESFNIFCKLCKNIKLK